MTLPLSEDRKVRFHRPGGDSEGVRNFVSIHPPDALNPLLSLAHSPPVKQKYPIPDVGHSLGPFPSRQQVSTAALNKKTIIAIQQDFKIHRIPVDDTNKANIMAHFPEATEFINSNLDPSPEEPTEEGEEEVEGENPGEGSAEVGDGKRRGGVLVHCQAGVSRSTSLVAAYLMKEKGVTCDGASRRLSSAPLFFLGDCFRRA